MVKQIIIIRKDLLKIPDCELNILPKDRYEQYMKELNEIGKMGPGKLAAQVAHASMSPILKKMRGCVDYKDYIAPNKDYKLSLDMKKSEDLTDWLEKAFTKIILYVKSEEKLLSIHKQLNELNIINELIEDIGKTEFKKPTITALGIIPTRDERVNKITKRLRLLN